MQGCCTGKMETPEGTLTGILCDTADSQRESHGIISIINEKLNGTGPELGGNFKEALTSREPGILEIAETNKMSAEALRRELAEILARL